MQSRTMQRQSSNLANRPSVGSHEGFAAFISHAKAEASMEARFLQTELEGRSARSKFRRGTPHGDRPPGAQTTPHIHKTPSTA
jgi:hypothetical protein